MIATASAPASRTGPGSVAWYPRAFTERECGLLVTRFGDGQPAPVQLADGSSTVETMARDALMTRVEREPASDWLYERVTEVSNAVNDAAFGLELTGGATDIRVLPYFPGRGVRWHFDVGPGEFSARKLSIIVQLSAPHDDDRRSWHVPRRPVRAGRGRPVHRAPTLSPL